MSYKRLATQFQSHTKSRAAKFRTRQRQPGESLDLFVRSIKNLTSQIIKGVSPDVMSQKTIEAILNKLPQAELLTSLLMTTPSRLTGGSVVG